MFFLSKPTTTQIGDFLHLASTTDFSYPFIGATRDGFGPRQKQADTMKYNIDHNQIVIGNGEDDLKRAKQAIREWKMFDFPWVELCWPNTIIEEDRTVAIKVQHFGFYSLNAARIVYTIDESDRFGFAYGTLEDHEESGEERFSVRLDHESGDVIYDLYAFSRPNGILSRLGYPLARVLQKKFAAHSKLAMKRSLMTP